MAAIDTIQPGITVVRTSTLVNFLVELSSEDLTAAGSYGQVQLTKHETAQLDVVEFFNTLEDAQAEKTSWDT